MISSACRGVVHPEVRISGMVVSLKAWLNLLPSRIGLRWWPSIYLGKIGPHRWRPNLAESDHDRDWCRIVTESPEAWSTHGRGPNRWPKSVAEIFSCRIGGRFGDRMCWRWSRIIAPQGWIRVEDADYSLGIVEDLAGRLPTRRSGVRSRRQEWLPACCTSLFLRLPEGPV